MSPATIAIGHAITPDSGQLFPVPQICEISPHLLSPAKIPAGAPVLCRLSNGGGGGQFLCRWFAPAGHKFRTKPVCFVDDGVRVLDGGEDVRMGNACGGVPELRELVVVEQELCGFRRVGLELSVDCGRMELELVRDRRELVELVRDVIRPYLLGENCLISFNERDDSNYGIVGILVRIVDGCGRFGYVNRETNIIIDKVLFHPFRSKQPKKLGGISMPEKDVRECLRNSRTDNVLLAGPPGSGKYSLIRQLAREGNHPLLEIRGLDFIKSHPGETELELRKVFERLERLSKLFGNINRSILLVKDVDRICPKLANKKGEDLSNISRISSQFTSLLDKHHSSESNIIVIGTTSNLESLDSRVRRPGRLGVEVFLRMPSESQRREIVDAILQQTATSLTKKLFDEVVSRTPAYVGADLELLVHTIQRTLAKNPTQNFKTTLDESLKKVRPTALRDSVGLISGLQDTLDTIGGMDQLKKTLRVSILGPLQHPEAFRRFGMSPLKGILLYGPPGCAKTTIARCLAAESRMTFVSVSAAEVYSPYVGDAEKLISRLFNQARQSAPAVIFLDEIDTLVGSRGGVRSANDVNVRVLSTLLTEMDGIGVSVQSTVASSEDSRNILVIAATNRPDMVDDALLRPGRLTKLIHVQAPDETARFEILKKVVAKIPLAEDVDLRQLAERTERYSGADLQNLCGQAALHAAALNENVQQISAEHFEHVLQETRPSLSSKQIEWYAQFETKHRTL